jgi:aminoglycoside phosphotransferase (APT) family kinase protein
MLPQSVLDLIAAAFPGQPIGDIAPTFGGFSHRSAALTIGELRCVVKAADTAPKRADLRHESRILALLRGSGLPIPTMLALAENQRWTAEVLGLVSGTHGLRLLADAPTQLPTVYGELGRLLARVHHLAPAPAPADLVVSERATHVLQVLPTLDLDAPLRAALLASLEHPAWRPDAPVLIHGDAGLHNLLWDAGIAALLDWEWAGWGAPLQDLAWVYWTIRWRNLDRRLWPLFLAGYAPGRPATSVGPHTALRALALGQIASMLVRAQNDAGAWQEWLRRARWTLALDFSE